MPLGALDNFAPKMPKRVFENKREPLKIAIDCNIKACSMLQISLMGCAKLQKLFWAAY